MRLEGKTIVIGVTGGIAAYKACEIVSSLKKMNANVHVVMTKNATEFVSPLTFETLSNNKVITDMFLAHSWDVEHIALAKLADAFLIVPCTANFVGKLANGIADDFLSTTIMAAKCQVFLAPAMNTSMYNSASYKDNEKSLHLRGVKFISPQQGRLACGDVGEGKLARDEDILDVLINYLVPKQDYLGETVLITAGATQESLDPVRFISNHSSGKMGLALAKAVSNRGGKVILIAGNIQLAIDSEWELIRVVSTADMMKAVMDNMARADIIIKAAAPADYRLKKVSKDKLKAAKIVLTLVKNPDIAKEVGKKKGNKKLVIFCAESRNLEKSAKSKLAAKNADLVVANDVTMQGAGFNVDTNIAMLITAKESQQLEIMSKYDLANIILDKVKSIK